LPSRTESLKVYIVQRSGLSHEFMSKRPYHLSSQEKYQFIVLSLHFDWLVFFYSVGGQLRVE